MSGEASRASAVALAYPAGANAPTVVAKGYGVTAESIKRVARERGVYVHASPQLVDVLMNVQLDREIPPCLYVAVAEVMAWIAAVERRAGTTASVRDGTL
jgi:flagellar biosynthesis protein